MCSKHKMNTIQRFKNVELFFKRSHKTDFYHVFDSCFRAKMWKNSSKTRIKLIFTTFSTFYFLLRIAPKSLIYKGKTLSHTFPHFSKTFRLQKLVKSFLPLIRWNYGQNRLLVAENKESSYHVFKLENVENVVIVGT